MHFVVKGTLNCSLFLYKISSQIDFKWPFNIPLGKEYKPYLRFLYEFKKKNKFYIIMDLFNNIPQALGNIKMHDKNNIKHKLYLIVYI